ncbi:hypothetical protein ABZP36_015938 [Zizania latifolia]
MPPPTPLNSSPEQAASRHRTTRKSTLPWSTPSEVVHYYYPARTLSNKSPKQKRARISREAEKWKDSFEGRGEEKGGGRKKKGEWEAGEEIVDGRRGPS